MKAVYLNTQTGPGGLIAGELPRPNPAAGEILVEVRATAVTPSEFQWYPTFHTREGQPRAFPIVPGHEFSGVVAALGDGVDGFKIGDAVYGLNDWFSNGALAEYCVASPQAVALKPVALDHPAAAVLPISVLTAWQGLFEHGMLKAGQRVLIHGGSGGVGLFAVQFARWCGARVVATASTDHLDFVRSLGADEVIDYKTSRFEEHVRELDLVFDTVGGATLDRSWSVIRDGGKVVTVAVQVAAKADARARAAFFLVEARGSELAEIAALFDAGKIRAAVADVLPLEQAREAYARGARGGLRGKIALQVTG